jgi:hypothetical protein
LVAERILREIIVHEEFARDILSTLCGSLKWFREDDYKGKGGRLTSVEWSVNLRMSPSVTYYAFILLILIRQRAEYLFSRDGLYECVVRWKTVYIS